MPTAHVYNFVGSGVCRIILGLIYECQYSAVLLSSVEEHLTIAMNPNLFMNESLLLPDPVLQPLIVITMQCSHTRRTSRKSQEGRGLNLCRDRDKIPGRPLGPRFF
jgi:hypothetical protein